MINRNAALLLAATTLLATPLASAHARDPILVAISDRTAPAAIGDVLDVAAQSGQFTTFLRIVEAAGMEETLRSDGPFTLFAPTDVAFRAMDQRQLDLLMDPQRHDERVAFVSYHVVAERVTTAAEAGQQRHEESASGDFLRLDGRDGLRVNNELVAIQDMTATNGIIQGINSALRPPLLMASR